MPGADGALSLSARKSKIFMVSQCVNPACRAAFLYLRHGKLFVLRAGPASPAEVFWLCDACTASFTIEVAPDGGIHLTPLSKSTSRKKPSSPAVA
jgi:hypothetical protein